MVGGKTLARAGEKKVSYELLSEWREGRRVAVESATEETVESATEVAVESGAEVTKRECCRVLVDRGNKSGRK